MVEDGNEWNWRRIGMIHNEKHGDKLTNTLMTEWWFQFNF
jgi:hypothetical protein